jgi:hypothetical protein
MLVGLTVTDWERAGKTTDIVKQTSKAARIAAARVIKPRVCSDRLFPGARTKAEDFAFGKTDER